MQLITKKVMFGFLLTFSIVCIIGVVSYRNAKSLTADMRAVTHEYQVMAQLSDVFSTVQDVQTSGRGYGLTGKQEFLEPYEEAMQRIHLEMKELHDLVSSEPDQNQRVHELEQLIAQEISVVQGTIDARNQHGLDAAIERVGSGKGNTVMAKIRQKVRDIDHRESDLAMIRDQQAQRSDALTTTVITAGTILSLLIVCVASLALHRDVVQRERLERNILEISDREQQRFGRDLHDSLCQELSGISFIAQILEKQLQTANSSSAKEASQVVKLTSDALNHARSFARGLQPVEVESNGLMTALEDLARNVETMFRLECRFVCHEPMLVARNTTAMHLYRIAQEAVHNAVRHGRAKRIEIRLLKMGSQAVLQIEDDGKGFGPDSKKSPGMGLRTMSYRAAALGGQFRITSAGSTGTLVQCFFDHDRADAKSSRELAAV